MPIRNFTLILCMGWITLASLAAGPSDSLVALLDPTRVNEEQVGLHLEIAEEISNSDIRGALEHAKTALSMAEEIGSRELVADSKLAIGKYFDYLGIMDEAIGHLTDAITIFEETDMPAKEAQALMLIGNAYWYLNQYDPALKYYQEVSRFGEELNDTSLIIKGINARGAVYGNTRKMDSALILFDEAHELALKIGSQDMVILTYFNMGDVNLYSGNIDDALGIFYDLEQNYDMEKHSSKHLSNLLNSMTRAFILKGDLKWAKRYSEKTFDVLNQNLRLPELKDYYLNSYEIDMLENNTESALEHHLMYTRLNDSLNNTQFKDQMANLEIYFDLRTKEGEIERLTLDNQLKDLEIRQRRTVNYGTIALIILLLTIGFLAMRSTLLTRKQNRILEDQKNELEKANRKIKAQSRDLADKNNELESVIDELKATQQHLVQSEKMASLGTLTAGIAHEINNPLNFISGGLGIIEESANGIEGMGEKEIEERKNRALRMAFDGLERATGIVKALMTFSRKGGSKLIESDLHEIIDNTLLFLRSKITVDIEIKKEYQLKNKVPVFQEKMHQVIMNIIDNAIFAVNSHGGRDKSILISTGHAENMAILTITNNGPHIEEHHLSQLFDPFFTTKDPGAGTGLGLSISYNLIAEHEGTLRAENRDNGVSFIIEIPA